MIVTLTLNPSLDRSVEVGALTRGAVIRATSTHLDPGGKGVNVTRALLANGVKSRAVLPSGGYEGDQLVRLLAADGVDVVAVPIALPTRSNITIVEPDGLVTKVNEPGATLTPAEFDRVAKAVLECTDSADWVVMCGSLPPHEPAGVYAELCDRFTGAGIRVAVDTSGPPLLAAVAARPALVKPNLEELEEAVGRPVTTLGDAVRAAQELHALGAGAVLVSLGADGAVLVDADGVLTGQAPVAFPRNPVGAGDAMLAGFLAAGARGAGALTEALAWGAAAVTLPGSGMPGSADIHREAVRIDPAYDPNTLLRSRTS
ncbi:1-phosphofructokinase [Streptomycetaceae bacterium NBC_01309]